MRVKNNKWLCVNIKLLLDNDGKVIYFKELSYKSRIVTLVEMFLITKVKPIIFYDNDVNKELIEEFKKSINVDYKWLKNIIVYIEKRECLELIKSNNIKEYFICDLNDKEWLDNIFILKGFDEIVKHADNIIESFKVKTKLIRVVTDEQYRKIKENNLIYKIEKEFYNPCSYAYFDTNDIRSLFNNKEIISIYNNGKLVNYSDEEPDSALYIYSEYKITYEKIVNLMNDYTKKNPTIKDLIFSGSFDENDSYYITLKSNVNKCNV